VPLSFHSEFVASNLKSFARLPRSMISSSERNSVMRVVRNDRGGDDQDGTDGRTWVRRRTS
jgi:hypothetical protein